MAVFAAIRLDDAVRRTALLAYEALAATGVELRFERPEKLHVTLAFLGRIDAARMPAFVAALQAAATSCAPFDIAFDTLGAFPDERRPRIVWLGCSTPQPGYDLAAGRVRAGFEALGVRFDQPAVPHITLARAKTPLRGLPRIEQSPRCVLAVREVALFESIQAGATTRYDERAIAPLNGT